MKKNFSSIAQILPVFAGISTLFFGLACGLFFYTTLIDNHHTSAENLGTMLAKQLATSSLQPLIHRDSLSIQVAVTEIASVPGVSKAAVFDAQDQPIAQNTASTGKNALTFTSPIILEGTPAGKASVALDQDFLFAPYQQFMQGAFLLWLLLSFLVVFIAAWFGKKWSAQLCALTTQLPRHETHNIEENCSEISQLEQALAPILNVSTTNAQITNLDSFQAILSLSCRNLSRLQTQLTGDNLTDVLSSLDGIISFILKLYDGQRLNTYNQTICLAFNGTEAESDHSLRALYAAFSALQLIEQLQNSKGIKVDCAMAITLAPIEACANHIQSALLVEEQLLRNNQLLNMASLGEILLDRETGTHPALDDTALLEPLSPDQQMFRCDGLEETAETLVKRQLVFFKAQ